MPRHQLFFLLYISRHFLFAKPSIPTATRLLKYSKSIGHLYLSDIQAAPSTSYRVTSYHEAISGPLTGATSIHPAKHRETRYSYASWCYVRVSIPLWPFSTLPVSDRGDGGAKPLLFTASTVRLSHSSSTRIGQNSSQTCTHSTMFLPRLPMSTHHQKRLPKSPPTS